MGEKNLLTPIRSYKLFNNKHIFGATFLGGPLVAGYMMAENFKTLGQDNKVSVTWIITLTFFIALFSSLFFLPGIEKIPNYLIPMTYGAVAQMLGMKYQGTAVKEHIDQQGEVYSVGRVILISLICLIITIAVLVPVVFMMEM